MRRITGPVILLFVMGASVFAAPATKPASDDDPKLTRLIAQLGDNDPIVRDRAADQIKAIGLAALPALKRAAEGDDPEVAARARALADLAESLPAEGRRHIYDWSGGFRENSNVFDTQIDNRSDYTIESVSISIRIINRSAGTESWHRVLLRPSEGPIRPGSTGKLSGKSGVKPAENETYNWNIDIIRGKKTR